MADLQRKSYNLFDKNATDTSNGYEANHYLDGNGDSGASSNHNISEYIDISQYSTITISGAETSSYSIQNTFYNANKEKISHFPCNTMPKTVTVPNNAKYIRITISKVRINEIMLNTGSTALPYEPYGWVHSLRKLCSATETIQSGDTIYANGQPISTYSIKGNTVQSGTPTPSNPVAVSGTGDRTENLYNIANVVENTFIKASTTGTPLGSEISNSEWSCSDYIEVSPNTEYTVQYPSYTYAAAAGLVFFTSKSVSSAIEGVTTATQGSKTYTFTTPNNCNYVRFSWGNNKGNETMFVTGGTAKTYEPYGFKIPILNGQTALTPVYLTEPLMKISSMNDELNSNNILLRKIRKMVCNGSENWNVYSAGTSVSFFYLSVSANKGIDTVIMCTHYERKGIDTVTSTVGIDLVSDGTVMRLRPQNVASDFPDLNSWTTYLQQQYENGTPVTIWYALNTATTETVTAPSIPTTDGANSITVDTTVQPSEFTATWTGWHDASVQEYTALLASNPLCGIDTYKDTLNLATGECTRRIVKIIYKGASDENWNKSSSGYNGFYIGIPYHEAGTQIFCNMAQYDSNGTLYRSAPWYCVSDWTFAISTDSAVVGETTVTWKAYLATLYANGTPLTIWHVTDTPTTETITVPTGLTGTEEGYLTQSGTPTPSNPIYPTANEVDIWQ